MSMTGTSESTVDLTVKGFAVEICRCTSDGSPVRHCIISMDLLTALGMRCMALRPRMLVLVILFIIE